MVPRGSPTRTTSPFTDFAAVTPETPIEQLDLNWRERDLPERERTKHVHRLHPYLGKFVPQLAEIFLRKVRPHLVCDPFCGSGTTLVEAAALGIDSVGCDISEFNCLLARVKTARYELCGLEQEIRDILERVNGAELDSPFPSGKGARGLGPGSYLQSWFHPRALAQLLAFRDLIAEYRHQDVLRVILSRAARSARLAPHFELDWPKQPQTEPYWCYKHRRTCRPTDDALRFLNRYGVDALRRIGEFGGLRGDAAVDIRCGDARSIGFPDGIDLVLTSPPYVGIIDYHEQHRYAYELLGLGWRTEDEIGPAFRGSSKAAQQDYVQQIAAVFANLQRFLTTDATVVVVVHDRYRLYDELPARLGFRLQQQLERHVNRRTGLRSGDFYESILIWKRKEESPR